jgi:hypothetical protein
MKLPVSFEQFSKDPVKALLFILISVVGYLYWDIKSSYGDQILQCNETNQALVIKVDKLTDHVRRSDSALGYSISKIEMLDIMCK